MDISQIPTGENPPKDLFAIIEIPMGGVPVNVPITWTPKFPMGAVWLAGLVGAVGAGVGAVMSRLILGVGLNDVLYYRPGTNFSNTAMPILSHNLDTVSNKDI